MKKSLSLVFTAALLCAGMAHADQDAGVTRLRDALKNTLLQLRTVTTDRDNLQSQVTDLQSQNDVLTKQLAALTKRAADEKTTDKKTIAELQGQVSDQEDSIGKLQASLDSWKKSQNEAVVIANATEAKRAKLAELSIHLQRMVDDQRRKNIEMYKAGMELLDRYQKFGLGQALTAKEPFTGNTRTKFETLIQDYNDKLIDASITDSPEKSADSKPKQQ